MAKRRIAVLGSTGSIGTQTLDVVRQHGDKLEIVGLAVNSSLDVLLAQAREFGVRHLAVGNAALANDPRCDEARALVRSLALPEGQEGVEASFGVGSEAVVALTQLPEVDVVVNALVGAAGLEASYATLKAGKVLALANKESLVVGGDLIMPLAASVDAARVLPVPLRRQGRQARSCPSIRSMEPSTNVCSERTRARSRSCG